MIKHTFSIEYSVGRRIYMRIKNIRENKLWLIACESHSWGKWSVTGGRVKQGGGWWLTYHAFFYCNNLLIIQNRRRKMVFGAV